VLAPGITLIRGFAQTAVLMPLIIDPGGQSLARFPDRLRQAGDLAAEAVPGSKVGQAARENETPHQPCHRPHREIPQHAVQLFLSLDF